VISSRSLAACSPSASFSMRSRGIGDSGSQQCEGFSSSPFRSMSSQVKDQTKRLPERISFCRSARSSAIPSVVVKTLNPANRLYAVVTDPPALRHAKLYQAWQAGHPAAVPWDKGLTGGHAPLSLRSPGRKGILRNVNLSPDMLKLAERSAAQSREASERSMTRS
jgi:hypothetical protein